MKNFYDVAVVGSNISGLLTANLLSKRGLRLVMVQLSQSALSQALPQCPILLPNLSRLHHAVEAMNQELGLLPLWRQYTKNFTPNYQVLVHGGEKARFDLGKTPTAVGHEIGLMYPEWQQAAEDFVAGILALDRSIPSQLPPGLLEHGWWQTLLQRFRLWSWRAYAGNFFEHPLSQLLPPPNHPVRLALLAPLYVLGNLDADNPKLPLLHVVRTLAAAYSGLCHFSQGFKHLAHLLLNQLTAAGVECRQVTTLPQLRGERRGFVLRATVGSLTPYQCQAQQVIWNIDPTPVELKLPSVEPVGYSPSLPVVIKRQFVPHRLGSAAILFPPWRWQRSTPLLLQRYAPNEAFCAHPNLNNAWHIRRIFDEEILVLTRMFPHNIWGSSLSREQLKEHLLHEAAAAIPYLDDAVVKVDWSATKNLPLWHYATKANTPLGLGNQPLQTKLPGLYHASSACMAGLGFEGQCYAALHLAALLQKQR